jgi:hypothetical protein
MLFRAGGESRSCCSPWPLLTPASPRRGAFCPLLLFQCDPWNTSAGPSPTSTATVSPIWPSPRWKLKARVTSTGWNSTSAPGAKPTLPDGIPAFRRLPPQCLDYTSRLATWMGITTWTLLSPLESHANRSRCGSMMARVDLRRVIWMLTPPSRVGKIYHFPLNVVRTACRCCTIRAAALCLDCFLATCFTLCRKPIPGALGGRNCRFLAFQPMNALPELLRLSSDFSLN